MPEMNLDQDLVSETRKIITSRNQEGNPVTSKDLADELSEKGYIKGDRTVRKHILALGLS